MSARFLGCPAAIYRIMADCWSPLPEARPTFSNLLERLNTCTQVSARTIYGKYYVMGRVTFMYELLHLLIY